MNIQEEVEDVKKELVDLIVKHLRTNKLDAEEAKKLAADFLAVLPIESYRDLLNKLKSLGEKYDEAKKIYTKELRKVSLAQDEEVLNKMRDAISEGKIEEAILQAKSMRVQI